MVFSWLGIVEIAHLSPTPSLPWTTEKMVFIGVMNTDAIVIALTLRYVEYTVEPKGQIHRDIEGTGCIERVERIKCTAAQK